MRGKTNLPVYKPKPKPKPINTRSNSSRGQSDHGGPFNVAPQRRQASGSSPSSGGRHVVARIAELPSGSSGTVTTPLIVSQSPLKEGNSIDDTKPSSISLAPITFGSDRNSPSTNPPPTLKPPPQDITIAPSTNAATSSTDDIVWPLDKFIEETLAKKAAKERERAVYPDWRWEGKSSEMLFEKSKLDYHKHVIWLQSEEANLLKSFYRCPGDKVCREAFRAYAEKKFGPLEKFAEPSDKMPGPKAEDLDLKIPYLREKLMPAAIGALGVELSKFFKSRAFKLLDKNPPKDWERASKKQKVIALYDLVEKMKLDEKLFYVTAVDGAVRNAFQFILNHYFKDEAPEPPLEREKAAYYKHYREHWIEGDLENTAHCLVYMPLWESYEMQFKNVRLHSLTTSQVKDILDYLASKDKAEKKRRKKKIRKEASEEEKDDSTSKRKVNDWYYFSSSSESSESEKEVKEPPSKKPKAETSAKAPPAICSDVREVPTPPPSLEEVRDNMYLMRSSALAKTDVSTHRRYSAVKCLCQILQLIGCDWAAMAILGDLSENMNRKDPLNYVTNTVNKYMIGFSQEMTLAPEEFDPAQHYHYLPVMVVIDPATVHGFAVLGDQLCLPGSSKFETGRSAWVEHYLKAYSKVKVYCFNWKRDKSKDPAVRYQNSNRFHASRSWARR